jgi:hypothetical protein
LSGLRILRALAQGQRDPVELAKLGDRSLHSSKARRQTPSRQTDAPGTPSDGLPSNDTFSHPSAHPRVIFGGAVFQAADWQSALLSRRKTKLYLGPFQLHPTFAHRARKNLRLVYRQGVHVLFQWRTESTIQRNAGHCAHTGLCALVCRQSIKLVPRRCGLNKRIFGRRS